MKRSHAAFVAILTALSLTSGCRQMANYEGDGKLLDNGPKAATDRYVLDLGPVDLSRPGAKTYRLKNLPAANYVVGLEIRAGAGAQSAEQQLSDLAVSVALSGPGAGALIAKNAPLRAWTWSMPADGEWAFVYGRDQPRTYFDAAPGAEYALTFEVLPPARADQRNVSARLVAKSGGWK